MLGGPYIHSYVLVISDPKSSSEMLLILTRRKRCDWTSGRLCAYTGLGNFKRCSPVHLNLPFPFSVSTSPDFFPTVIQDVILITRRLCQYGHPDPKRTFQEMVSPCAVGSTAPHHEGSSFFRRRTSLIFLSYSILSIHNRLSTWHTESQHASACAGFLTPRLSQQTLSSSTLDLISWTCES